MDDVRRPSLAMGVRQFAGGEICSRVPALIDSLTKKIGRLKSDRWGGCELLIRPPDLYLLSVKVAFLGTGYHITL